MPSYYLLHKPYGVLSQFTQELPGQRTLADGYGFPPGVYPVGRLDQDSEGLLLLTDDARLNQCLLSPDRAHPRTYWVQVEGIPSPEALSALRRGPSIRLNKKEYRCRPLQAELMVPPPDLPERDPPVRFRQHIPTTWLALTLTEGKNRQVRRMCAAVGYPVLRLLRASIGTLELGELAAGQVRTLSEQELRALLG